MKKLTTGATILSLGWAPAFPQDASNPDDSSAKTEVSLGDGDFASKNPLVEPKVSTLEAKHDSSKANFLYLSAIKTINGKKNHGEFLDIAALQTFALHGNWRSVLWTDINLDFDLSKDTAIKQSSSYCLATANLAYRLPNLWVMGILGGGIRVYEGVPLYAVQVGAIGTDDAILTSHFTTGWVRRIREEDATVSKNIGKDNLLFSVSLHTSKFSYLKALRLKGDLIIPLGDIGTTYRTAVEVPIGGILQW